MSEVKVEYKDGSIIIKTPFLPAFIDELKKAIFSSDREYNPREKAWIIKDTPENRQAVEYLVNKYFSNLETKLIFTVGSVPIIGGIPLIEYSRDGYRHYNTEFFSVVESRRVGDTGSRKYPVWRGYCLIKAKINSNIKIEFEKDGAYKVFNYSIAVLEYLKQIVHEFADNYGDDFSKVDFENLEESVKEILSSGAIKAPTPKVSEGQQTFAEPIIVKGFLVLTSLPSKSLLNEYLPEFYKDRRVGNKYIKVVTGYFYNKLGTLSRKYYTQILPRYAIDVGFGYIIPTNKVAFFLREVDELKKEYEIYEEQLRDFLEKGEVPDELLENDRVKIDEDYVRLVREYLKMHGIEEIKIPNITDRVRVRLIPLNLDSRIIKELVEQDALKAVEYEIAQLRNEIIQNARKDIEDKVSAIVDKIKRLAKKRVTEKTLNKIREEINNIRATATSLGIPVPELNILDEVVDLAEQGKMEEMEQKIMESMADGRLKALIEELKGE